MQRQDPDRVWAPRAVDELLLQALCKLAASPDVEHAACARAVLRALEGEARGEGLGRAAAAARPRVLAWRAS